VEPGAWVPRTVSRVPRTPAGGSYPRAAGRDPLAAIRWPGIPAGESYPPGPIPGTRSPGRDPRADGTGKGPLAIGSNAADRGPRAIFQRSRPAVY
jgi:hypothetical protein